MPQLPHLSEILARHLAIAHSGAVLCHFSTAFSLQLVTNPSFVCACSIIIEMDACGGLDVLMHICDSILSTSKLKMQMKCYVLFHRQFVHDGL